MAATTSRQRLLWLAIGVALMLAAVAGWRSYQARALQSQWDREHDAMKKGAVEIDQNLGSPKKAMEHTGDPFSPRPGSAKGTPEKERSR